MLLGLAVTLRGIISGPVIFCSALLAGALPLYGQLLQQPAPPRPLTAGDLYGHVRLLGASLPWTAIRIEVSCQGKPRLLTYTDVNGRFVLRSDPKAPDVTEGAPIRSATAYSGCEVTPVLTGYRASPVRIPKPLKASNVGTILLTRDASVRGAAVSHVLVHPDAQSAFDQARRLAAEGDTDQARQLLQEAIHRDPHYAEAWYQYANYDVKLHPANAEESYRSAIAADPGFLPPYEKLSMLAVAQQNWDKLSEITSQALELNPGGTARLWYYRAIADYHAENISQAESDARRALRMDRFHRLPGAEQLLAVVLTAQDKYAEAIHYMSDFAHRAPTQAERMIAEQQIRELRQRMGSR